MGYIQVGIDGEKGIMPIILNFCAFEKVPKGRNISSRGRKPTEKWQLNIPKPQRGERY